MTFANSGIDETGLKALKEGKQPELTISLAGKSLMNCSCSCPECVRNEMDEHPKSKHGTTCKYCEDHSVQLKSLETELILQLKLPSVHPDFAAVSFLTDTVVVIFCQQVTKFTRLDISYLLIRGIVFHGYLW